MYFWKTYPSPGYLLDRTALELTEELRGISRNFKQDKAELILDCIQKDGNTIREYQESRDFITQSLVRDLEHQKEELNQLDRIIKTMLNSFQYRLTSMPGNGGCKQADNGNRGYKPIP